MKKLIARLIVAASVISVAQFANADSKRFSMHGGIGTGRTGAFLVDGEDKVEFGGWGAHLLGGIEIPFSQRSSMILDVSHAYSDLRNNAGSNTMREDGSLIQTMGRVGLSFSRIELGVGHGIVDLRTTLVSTAGASVEAKFNGTASMAYGAVSFDIEDRARFLASAEYYTGKIDTFDFTGYRILLNCLVLFPL